MIKIAPSLLAGDFSRMGEEVANLDRWGSDLIHLDVMDGHFVPNITFGADVVRSLRGYTQAGFDTHLMISRPLDFIEDFALAGADIITFNLEASSPADETIALIGRCGCVPSVCIKPATPAEAVFPYLDKVGMVLVMTVEPGFGGQQMLDYTLEKIKTIRRECLTRGLDTDIEADGGINAQNVGTVAAAGANVIVAGSAVFRSADPAGTIARLRAAAQEKYLGAIADAGGGHARA
ncbi:MAG TPA: ribulose-phosphate 3-epimerase [Clostridiales bacterium]|nr:MAG: Ribulose-phosphate 3-epimerase [Firmicutes bacterium ADurb.Bin262]HOU09074.1 ribulose-phosphate 3-epimerase [Clostridiales bacterium]HQH64038.1 ribulose-phosphate 3-epimerase [Clostridiales bacterium]HQK72665.1 ribulose-phosphate 3-epimerase [Clostridiales bacterium]